MLGIKIVWIISNVIVGAWLSFTVLVNPTLGAAMDKWGNAISDRISLGLFIVLEALHMIAAIALCLFTSINTAVIATSLMLFNWALISYFLLQRFENAFDRPIRIHKHPMFHPLVALGSFLLSIFAIISLVHWSLAFFPVVIWLFVGSLCAEVAIRRYIRRLKQIGEKCDRDMAIFAVNNAQGRCDPTSIFKNRYPFP
jgi:hypothetical protein